MALRVALEAIAKVNLMRCPLFLRDRFHTILAVVLSCWLGLLRIPMDFEKVRVKLLMLDVDEESLRCFSVLRASTGSRPRDIS